MSGPVARHTAAGGVLRAAVLVSPPLPMVSHNANTAITSLQLAHTFGGFLTAIEHFASHSRPAAANPELWAVPDSFVRLGVGCERQQTIAADLLMALNSVGTLVRRGVNVPDDLRAWVGGLRGVDELGKKVVDCRRHRIPYVSKKHR